MSSVKHLLTQAARLFYFNSSSAPARQQSSSSRPVAATRPAWSIWPSEPTAAVSSPRGRRLQVATPQLAEAQHAAARVRHVEAAAARRIRAEARKERTKGPLLPPEWKTA